MQVISFQNLDNFIPQSEFEEKVLLFCQDWRNNKQDFEFFTSGSTGTPKPLKIQREQMINSAQQTIDWLGLEKGNNAFLGLYPNYIAGAMVLVRALIAQMNLILVEPQENFFSEFTADLPPIHLASFVPNQWKTLLMCNLELNNYFGQAKGILLGGSDLDEETKAITSSQCRFPVYLTYGMTETVSHIAFQSLSINPINYLQTLPNVHISKDSNDCLVVSSPSTFGEKVVTQDLVEIISDSTFRIIGRNNRIINSAGLKINPIELEKEIGFYFKGIDVSFFITGLLDEFYGQKVVLIVKGNEFIYWNDLIQYLKGKFDKNWLPKEYILVKKFEITTSGKLDILSTLRANNLN